jgi:hypothetical protein
MRLNTGDLTCGEVIHFALRHQIVAITCALCAASLIELAIHHQQAAKVCAAVRTP